MKIIIKTLTVNTSKTQHARTTTTTGTGLSPDGESVFFDVTIVDGYVGGDYKQFKNNAALSIGEDTVDGTEAANFAHNARAVGVGGVVVFREMTPFMPTAASGALAVTVEESARIAGVSEQSIRDILKNDKRRAEIFPGAYRTSDHPQRGEWRIQRAEVEAWKPRKYPR